MKKYIIVLLILFSLFLLSCSNATDDDQDRAGIRDDSVIESYVYRSHHILLQDLPEVASGVLVH